MQLAHDGAVEHHFRLVAWLVCGIYATIPAFWLMVHPFAARWRRAQLRFTLLAPLWVLMWLAAWAMTRGWSATVLYHSNLAWLAPLLCWPVSLVMYLGGARDLTLARVIGRDEMDASRPPTLITQGIHARLRHPLYLGHLCTMLGWTAPAATLACYVLLLVAFLTGAIMVRAEERELLARFGAAWRDYCRRTPALWPRLRPRRTA